MSKFKCYLYPKRKYRSKACKNNRGTKRCNSAGCKLFHITKPKQEVFRGDNREREHDIHGRGYDNKDLHGPGNG